MRWFKHMTDSSYDERLADLIAECGLEAYGFWWRLLEIVACQMNKNSEKCSATYTLSKWSQLFYCHHHKVTKYFGRLAGLPPGYPIATPPLTIPFTPELLGGGKGMVTLEYVEGKIRVTIPNLLKYRDEYSKKSGVSPESVRSKKQNTDTEADTEIEKEIKSPPRMSLFQFRSRYRDHFGLELGGGVNQSASDLCKNFTADHIESAMVATATRSPRPKNPFSYMVKILENTSNSEPEIEEENEFTLALKASMQNGIGAEALRSSTGITI